MKSIFSTLLLIFLVILTIQVISATEPYILSSINLIFHEAGHPIFSLFGEFVGFLGGTIGQLFFPIVFIIYFLKQKDFFASTIMVWWFGESLVNSSIYIADARTQILPLIGGSHDWAYILGTTHMLQYDLLISKIVFSLGASCMTVALLYGFKIILYPYYLKYQEKNKLY